MSGRVSVVARLALTPEPVKPSETALALRVTPGEVQAADAVRAVIDDEAVAAMTARTTQPRLSQGPLGKRGRRCQERLGVVPVMGYHAPGHSADQAACLTAMSCGGGEGGRPHPSTGKLIAHSAGARLASRLRRVRLSRNPVQQRPPMRVGKALGRRSWLCRPGLTVPRRFERRCSPLPNDPWPARQVSRLPTRAVPGRGAGPA